MGSTDEDQTAHQAFGEQPSLMAFLSAFHPSDSSLANISVREKPVLFQGRKNIEKEKALIGMMKKLVKGIY